MKLFDVQSNYFEADKAFFNISFTRGYIIGLHTVRRFKWPYISVTIPRPSRWLEIKLSFHLEHRSPVVTLNVGPLHTQLLMDEIPF